jgi:DNA polymerase IV
MPLAAEHRSLHCAIFRLSPPIRLAPRRGVVSVRAAHEHTFVSQGATILHADLDSFYASVEQRDDPRLRGRPVVVGAGVVLAASYEAKARGVRTAMGGGQARRLCPEVAVVPPRFTAYSEASKAVFAVFAETAPVVEGLSIDEAFLDVRGLEHISGTPTEIAVRLRRQIRQQIGLPITVGIARTKFLAKVASGVAKPDGLLLVPPESELAFLHPLPVERLWGVGRVTSKKLRDRGISTVGEVAELSEAALVAMLGRAAGRHLHALAHNYDPRPVVVGRRRRSIGAQRALGRRPRGPDEIAAALIALVDRVARRLRAARRVCRTVVLRLRFSDYTRATRSYTMAEPTADTNAILKTATALLTASRATIERRGLTLVGIALTNLADQGAVQLVLPFDRRRDLDAALDRVRDRFGSAALTRGVHVGQDTGISVPMLPD